MVIRLDGFTTTSQSADRNMQQATVNIFADMGAQPATLIAGLVAATKSTDTTAPTSAIASGLNGQAVDDGAKVMVSGTASDVGGVVAGVEVSVDGGATWHPATGTSTWSFAWIAHGSPTVSVKAGRWTTAETWRPPAPVPRSASRARARLWGTNAAPDVADFGDASSVELGVKFTSDSPGVITGVRFYKSPNNKGTRREPVDLRRPALGLRRLHGRDGIWMQSVTFPAPVSIAANTTYVASYFAPQGHYAVSPGYFYRTRHRCPQGTARSTARRCTQLRSTPASGNGVYAYGAASSFPAGTYGGSNYSVEPGLHCRRPGAGSDVLETRPRGRPVWRPRPRRR